MGIQLSDESEGKTTPENQNQETNGQPEKNIDVDIKESASMRVETNGEDQSQINEEDTLEGAAELKTFLSSSPLKESVKDHNKNDPFRGVQIITESSTDDVEMIGSISDEEDCLSEEEASSVVK